MAKLTWLGSTEGYREGETPLDSCTWNGVLFTAGDKVEVTDEWMVNKAKGNRFFRVEEDAPPPIPPPEPPTFRAMHLTPETWTNDDHMLPPDYSPVDEPNRSKRGGRPKRIRDNGDGVQ